MQANATREYLHSLVQGAERCPLPVGPLLCSPDGLFPSLYRRARWAPWHPQHAKHHHMARSSLLREHARPDCALCPCSL